jgi:hypothetical protein
VDQTTPIDSTVTSSGSNSAASVSVNSATSDHYTAASTRTGESNVTMNWNLSEGKEWVALGININAAQ